MARPQPGIFAQGTRSHYHLEFDLRPDASDEAIDAIGQLGEAVAKGHARVRTGAMRGDLIGSDDGLDGIQWDGDVDELHSGDIPYTIYNELGTRYMSAQPMFGPAMSVMHAACGLEYSRAFRVIT